MTAVEISPSSSSARWSPLDDLKAMARAEVREHCEKCQAFILAGRERVLIGDPTPREREEYRQALRRLLGITRLLQAMYSDPDFESEAQESLDGVIWQLQMSWDVSKEHTLEEIEEAKKLLAEVFPDEPRA